MNEDVDFLRKHRTDGAIVDANLLLVYVVGRADRRLLNRSFHTQQYEDDFPLIERIIDHFEAIYTTPNILTEVSNLGAKVGAHKVLDVVAQIIIHKLNEQYCLSRDACGDPAFQKLGLTDAGLLLLAQKHLVVTADFNLHRMLRHRGLDAINFNHLRQASW